jgi:hypothetical protein
LLGYPKKTYHCVWYLVYYVNLNWDGKAVSDVCVDGLLDYVREKLGFLVIVELNQRLVLCCPLSIGWLFSQVKFSPLGHDGFGMGPKDGDVGVTVRERRGSGTWIPGCK